MNVARAPVTNYDLPLPPRTTLADKLQSWKFFRTPGKPESHVTEWAGHLGARWFDTFAARDAALQRDVRAQAADAARDAVLTVAVEGKLRRELEDVLPIMEQRREVGQAMANRLKSCAQLATPSNARDLTLMPEQMLLCRTDGHACDEVDSGERRFAFAYKCGSTRYCPDCAREHAMYEAERFGQACLEHVNRGRQYRAHYLVFTRPSVPLGKMEEGIEETLSWFREFLDAKRACSAVQQRKHGWSSRKKKIPVWQPAQRIAGQSYDGRDPKTSAIIGPGGPGIHGALVQVECHLTAKGMWHPHLNVILLTKGAFSYALARKLWGYNVGCRPIVPQAGDLARSFAELIKYPFRHVAEKSQAKADAGESEAPPFVEWPDAAVIEWHAATRAEVECADGSTRIQGSRWLRSYGSLHGIPPPESETQTLRPRCRLTLTDDGTYHLSAFVASIPGSKFQGWGAIDSIPARPDRKNDYYPPPNGPPSNLEES